MRISLSLDFSHYQQICTYRIGPTVLTSPSIRSGDPDHISPDRLNRSSCLIIIGGLTILACLTLGVFSIWNTDDVWLGIQHFNIGRCK